MINFHQADLNSPPAEAAPRLGDGPAFDRPTEFDLHGALGIRLLNALPKDIVTVRGQLGVPEQPLFRRPDITIRFVRELPHDEVRQVEFGRVRLGENGSLELVDEVTGRRSRIPVHQLGQPCEIICESGVPSIPFFTEILGLTALAGGYVPLHASAFVHRGTGMLMAGLAGSGKTTALLGFASDGAEFVGDDWILISRDGHNMHGLSTSMRVSIDRVKQLPNLGCPSGRLTFWFMVLLHKANEILHLGRSSQTTATFVRLSRRVSAALAERLKVRLSPMTIFDRRINPRARPDKIFLLLSCNATEIQVAPIAQEEMASRLTNLTDYEQSKLMTYYLALKCAFPDAENRFLERSSQRQRTILLDALKEKETYVIWHPHPLVSSDLYKTLQPLCRQTENILN